MAVAAALGGLIAARQFKRIDERLLKITLVSIGLALASGLFLRVMTERLGWNLRSIRLAMLAGFASFRIHSTVCPLSGCSGAPA